jgi:hypothetical protein
MWIDTEPVTITYVLTETILYHAQKEGKRGRKMEL